MECKWWSLPFCVVSSTELYIILGTRFWPHGTTVPFGWYRDEALGP